MKALIIDDEKKARQVLHILVEENCPKITEIFEAEDLLSGVALIKKEQPSVVFLDIEMPEHSAIDYLLKPVRPSQVKDAVDKAVAFMGNTQINKRLTELKASLQDSNFKKIGLPNDDGIKFVDFTDIITLEADGMYTNVSTVTHGSILVSKPLKFFVDILQDIKTFYRPHRSHLINLSYIKEYIKKDGGYIVMKNDKTVSISNDKKEEFLTIVQNIG